MDEGALLWVQRKVFANVKPTPEVHLLDLGQKLDIEILNKQC